MSEYATHFFYILRKNLNISNINGALNDFSHSSGELCGLKLFEHRDFKKKADFTHLPRKRIEDINDYLGKIAVDGELNDKFRLSLTFAFEENNSLDIGFDIAGRLVVFSINYSFFNPDYFQETNERVKAVLCFCKLFYKHFLPVYGYGITGIDDWGSPEKMLKIDQMELDTLYCYNFLGPELTAFYGLDILKNIPAWQVQEMSDGGVFLAIEENPMMPEKFRRNYLESIELLSNTFAKSDVKK